MGLDFRFETQKHLSYSLKLNVSYSLKFKRRLNLLKNRAGRGNNSFFRITRITDMRNAVNFNGIANWLFS